MQAWLPYLAGDADYESLKAVVEAWFEGHDKQYSFQGVNSLAENWQKCIDVAGDHT